MILRLATPDDIATLEYWDTKSHVDAAGGEDDTTDWAAEIARSAPWFQILIAETEDRPIGVVQIIDPHLEETRYLGVISTGFRAIDIWIGEESDLGRGYGSDMMRIALRQCFSESEVHTVLIDPLARNTDALRCYRKLGFREVVPLRFGEDDCIVMEIKRQDWSANWSPDPHSTH